MRTMLSVAVAFAAGALLFAGVRADDPLPLDKVPSAVMAAVKARFDGATIKGAEKEVADGKTLYEINFTHKGRTIDAIVTESGHFIAVETMIAVKELPKAVADAVAKQYPGAAVDKVEEIMKVSYEVFVKVNGKVVEVKLDENGKVLNPAK